MNVDLANQADTSSFCPPGHTSRPAFSPACFPSHRNAWPSLLDSWKARSAWSDLRSPTKIEGLVCQVLGPNLESPVQGPKRSPREKWPRQEEVIRWGAPGALNPHQGALILVLKQACQAKPRQNQAPRKEARKQLHLCGRRTVDDREEAKPARMYGSEIMRSDGGGRMSTTSTEAINKGGFAQSKADGWFLDCTWW